MRKKHLSLLLFTAATLTAEHGYCDALCDPQPACCFNSCECCPGPYTSRLTVRHREPGGIGYDQGYTSFDLFWAPNLGDKWYSFVDARGHVFNDGKWASNLGIGLRFLPECYDMVIGGNFYWDWRDTQHTNFHQLGAGLEFLWPCWDIRVNGYAPVNRHKRLYRKGFDGFKGHEARTFKKWELALWGVDAALGYWLYQSDCFGLHAAVAGYYFGGDFDKHAGGGLLRAKMQFWDWVELRGQVSYDNLFKWQGQGELALTLPFGCRVTRYQRQTNCCPTILSLEERLVEQPERFEIIVTTTKKKTCAARSPLTGAPLRFFFVDNTSGSSGTFEDPFPTLLEAQNASGPGDVIYVFPGDGTDSGMNLGITLQDDQIFTSAFLPFGIQSSCGNFVIPALSDARPKISNAGDVVKVANRNTVQGFEINGTTGGVVALNSINGLTVFNNIINTVGQGINAYGIRLEDIFSGTFIAKDNEINVSSNLGAFAIVFDRDINGSLLFDNNTIFANSTNSVAFGIFLNNFIGDLTVRNNNITLNSFLGSDAITLFDFTGNISFFNNNITINAVNSFLISSGIAGFGAINGSLFSKNNNISVTTTSGAANGVFYDEFNGNLQVVNDAISANGPDGASGITINRFDGELSISGSEITAIASSGVADAIRLSSSLNPSTGQANLSNNYISATSATNTARGVFLERFNGELSISGSEINATSNTGPANAITLGFNFNLFTGQANLSNNYISATSGSSFARGGFLVFDGIFTSNNDVILTSSNSSQAIGINTNTSFSGEMNVNGSSITATSGSSLARGFSLGPFNGTFTSNNTTIIASSNSSSAVGISSFGILFSGEMHINGCSITANSVSSTATGVSLNNFNGTFSSNRSSITVNSGSNTATGVSLTTFNGTFSSVDTDIFVASTSGLSTDISSGGPFSGDFTVQNNTMTSTSSTNGPGIVFLSTFSGDFLAEGNNITSSRNAALFWANFLTGSIQIADNIFSQPNTNTSFNPTVSISGHAEANIEGNEITSATSNQQAFRFVNTTAGSSYLRLFDNIISAPALLSDGLLQNNAGGTFEVESTNAAITGVEALNNGARLDEIGVITYVPFNP